MNYFFSVQSHKCYGVFLTIFFSYFVTFLGLAAEPPHQHGPAEAHHHPAGWQFTMPKGDPVLLEHGRSDQEWLGRWQDRHADQVVKRLGCHWNRQPQDLVREAGFKIRYGQRFFFGVFHVIEGAP
jgi:hypothetical protein